MIGKINVIIVDDYEVFRIGIKYMLKNIAFVENIYECVDSKQLKEQLKSVDPDVIFMDVNLGNESGIELTRKLMATYKNLFIIAITSSKDIEDFIGMVDAGAMGFLLKNVSQHELLLALTAIMEGNMYFSKEFLTAAKQLLPRNRQAKGVQLSNREKEVLKLICHGFSNQEIATKLSLSTHTIDAHRKKLLHKTGARNTASMIMIAVRDGVIEPD